MDATEPDFMDLLPRALDESAEALAGVDDADLQRPTPCSDWDVAHLIAHLVTDPDNFVLMFSGGNPDWSPTPVQPGDDWVGAFRAGADNLLTACREAGAEAQAGMGWQLGELAVHAWDLVRATGQSIELDPAVAQRGLDFMSASLKPEMRGDAFEAERPVPDHAPVHERLAAFAGRDPSWQRP